MAATDAATIESIDIERIALESDALQRIPRALALGHDILSLSSEGNQITIALPDAGDRDAIDRVRLVTGMHVRAIGANRDSIRARLSEAYPEAGDEAPAVRALDEIHALAVRKKASDVHIEPVQDGGRIRQRLDGILTQTRCVDPALHAQVVSRVKLLAGMDIADRRQPQDGRYTIESDGKHIDARISSMPTILGEKLVIRLLDHRAGVPTLEQLGLPSKYLPPFRRVVHSPHGFLVVCGPTGSGKTTTLYAAIAERNVDSENVCSVEDPVEVRVPGVAQVQINARAGVTFASALRSFLRQDPNVIMVGEMRDEETAAVAASAALSGQLVVTSLHANDAPKTIDRLVELGVSRRTIAAGLTAVLAQRLVRRLCVRCRMPVQISAAVALAMGLPNELSGYSAVGCSECAGTGYSGRSAIFECLFVSDAMRALIADGGSSIALAKLARESGYEPMLFDGIRRMLLGETTLEEIRRVLFLEASV